MYHRDGEFTSGASFISPCVYDDLYVPFIRRCRRCFAPRDARLKSSSSETRLFAVSNGIFLGLHGNSANSALLPQIELFTQTLSDEFLSERQLRN